MNETSPHPSQEYDPEHVRRPHQDHASSPVTGPSINPARELERERPLGCFIAKLLGEPTNDTKNQLAGNLGFLLRKKYGSAFDRTLIDLVIAYTPSGWCSILLYNGELVIRGNVTPNRNGIGESLFVASARAVAMVLQ